MNKEQIKRELRRSATKDIHPWHACRHHAFEAAREWIDKEKNSLFRLKKDDLRTFYLLVAEAL
jgi:hypothetical protein